MSHRTPNMPNFRPPSLNNGSLVPEKMPHTSSLSAPSVKEQLNTNELSIEEVILKKENDLSLARKSIKKLQLHLGTLIISEDEREGIDFIDEVEHMVAEVDQKDAFFAHQYNFKTNVRKKTII